mgnify:CR=1 FL=1
MKKAQYLYSNNNSKKPLNKNINPYMKRRPVKRTAFHRIGSRKQ